MDSPDYMPNLQSEIVSKGIDIKNGYITTPVCCPSRTETITGRYFHNVKNEANNTLKSTCTGMHVDAINNLYDPYNNNLFQVLNKNGYKTGIFGKLINDDNIIFCDNNTFTQKPIKAGMTRVYSMCQQNNYYCPKYRNYFNNGTDNFINLSSNQKQTYQSYQIGNSSLDWIVEKIINKESYFTWVGFHCPHSPYTPPPWTEPLLSNNGYLSNLTVPITPDFNYQVKEQQPYLEKQAFLNEYTLEFMNHGYRTRIASTLQVDIYIKELIDILIKYNEINNTYIIYSSDHGYHFGQHRLPCEKEQMFETDIHIPFYIRGPNITEKSITNKLIGNVDIMPTVLDLAGIDIPESVDGKSIKNVILNNTDNNDDVNKWRESYLVEFMANGNAYYNICGMWFPSNDSSNFIGQTIKPDATQNTGDDNNLLWILYGDNKNYGDTFRLLRILNDTINWVYAEYIDYHFNQTSFKNPYLYVLYDLTNDLYQLYNIYNNITKDIQNELHQMLMDYGSCSGSDCP